MLIGDKKIAESAHRRLRGLLPRAFEECAGQAEEKICKDGEDLLHNYTLHCCRRLS